MMTRKRYFIILLVYLLFVSACGAEVDVEATVAAAIAATEAAQPTDTPIPPTDTPVPPTETPIPPTDTPIPPTETAVPPTDTPEPPPTDTPIPEPEGAYIEIPQENGWIRYELLEDGLAMSLPDTWEPLTLDPELMGEALGDVGAQNPELESLYSSELVQNLVASGIKFYALDTDATAISQGTPTSVNILIQDLGIAIPFDSYIELNLTQLPTFYGDDIVITEERLEIDGVEASRISYETSLANAFGQVDVVRLEQYLILDGEIAYIISFGSVAALADQYETLFPEIAATFDFID